jgi:hypothetical protein
MHPEVVSEKPGHCPKCGMELILKGSEVKVASINPNNYTPLLVIISLILLVAATLSTRDYLSGNFVLANFISYFMVGFFLVFAGFKLVDLKGFAQGYSTYDLLAQKWFGYGYIYPFIELIFGLTMLLNLFPTQILILEILIMSFSGLGVAIKLLKKEKFQCACLGTFLKVPLTKVTLIEDFGMAILAALMLLL